MYPPCTALYANRNIYYLYPHTKLCPYLICGMRTHVLETKYVVLIIELALAFRNITVELSLSQNIA
jgi:hypothetical protein